MLSILIPEYNYDCTLLVNTLAEQCRRASLIFEILVMDDASSTFVEINRRIATWENCRFIESSENQGAAKTRNALVRMASYEWLLLLDCDLEVKQDSFVENYLKHLSLAPVLTGSVSYQTDKPLKDYVLRWKYGTRRESLSAKIRNKRPWSSLSTVNACIHRSVFDRVAFDEHVYGYGHEDTLFGLTLKRLGIKIVHLDNPLQHNGLDSGTVFLEKSLIAASKYATKPFSSDVSLQEEIRIFRVFNWLKRGRLTGLIAFKFRCGESLMRRQLLSNAPSLFLYDCYRLGFMCNRFRSRYLQ